MEISVSRGFPATDRGPDPANPGERDVKGQATGETLRTDTYKKRKAVCAAFLFIGLTIRKRLPEVAIRYRYRVRPETGSLMSYLKAFAALFVM